MSKIAFSKFGLKKADEIKTITFNDQEIEVKQYLPISDKVDMITRIVDVSRNTGNNYANPLKVNLCMLLEIVYAYTNISFTEKQKEDATKLYDLLVESGLAKAIFDVIPEGEQDFIEDNVWETIDSVYSYQTSALGIIEAISQNYDNLQFDVSQIQQSLKDPENLGMLKDVLTKLG